MSDKFTDRLLVNYRLLLVAIFLLAAVLRIYGLNNLSPPGLEHDEVAHWLINQDILAGNHAVYFTEAYGHEAGFHYVQTLFMVLLGDNALALRLPSAIAGLLLVAVSFALARRLFGLKTALLSSGLLAVLFWPVFYSRLALRAISLPLMSGLSAVLWWYGWHDKRLSRPKLSTLEYSRRSLVNPRLSYFLAAGLMAGLSLYTYMAARAVPFFWLLFTIYLLLFHRPELKLRRQGAILFFIVLFLVALPLVIFLLTTPGAEARVSEVDAPLQALLDGNLNPIINNSLKILGMFGLSGDPLWRQNVALLPVYGPLVSVFFYFGVLICLWLWRKPRYLFLILWLFSSAIPSILTIDAPSSIRIINALPIITLFPLIGLRVIHIFRPLSTVLNKLSPEVRHTAIYLALLALMLTYVVRTTRAVFEVWPAADEVQFVWQSALTEAAAYLDRVDDAGPVAVGGWTPETMDPPTMELTLRRDDLSLRYFDPGQTVIIPSAPVGQSTRVVRPAILPLEPFLESQLAALGAEPQRMEAFTLYQLPGTPAVKPQYPYDVNFGNELTFLGYDLLTDCKPGGASCELITYWRVEGSTDSDRSVFLHLVDPSGAIIVQDDGLGAPSGHWQAGDIILQRHTIEMPAGSDEFAVHIGVYNPDDGRRLLTGEGDDFTRLFLSGSHDSL